MKKFFAKFFLALPVFALAAGACTPKEDVVEEPVKYSLSADAAFTDGSATVTVTADKAAAEAVEVVIAWSESSTIPAEAITVAPISIKAGETTGKTTVTLDESKAELKPGKSSFVTLTGAVDKVVFDQVSISASRVDLNGVWSVKFDGEDDIAMEEVEEGVYMAKDVVVKKQNAAFKFRRDGADDLVFALSAAATPALDGEFEVAQGASGLIGIADYGRYDIALNPNEGKALISQVATFPTTVKEVKALITSEEEVHFDAVLSDVIVTYVNGKYAFVQDETAGLLIFGNFGLQAGMKLAGYVAGTAKQYNAQPEVVSFDEGIDLSKLVAATGVTVPVKDITIKELLADFDRWEACRVKLTGVKNADKDLAKKDNNIYQGEDVIDLFLQNEPTTPVEMGSTFDVVGQAVIFKTTKEVKIWEDAAISNVVAPKKELRLTRVWGKYPGDSGEGSVWTSAYSSVLPAIVGKDRTMAADDQYVYVAAAGAGVSGVLAIDIKDGATAKAVNMTGVEGGFFPTACVRTIYDPAGKKWILLVGTLAYDSDQTFNVYAYTNGIDAAPTKLISWNANGRRVGDFFNVVGDWSNGEIWARANGTTHAFMWPIKNGVAGTVMGTASMGYDGAKGMGQIYKYDVSAKQVLLVTPTIGRGFSYDDSEGYLNMGQGGIDWVKSDNSAFAKLFGIKPFEFEGQKYIAYVRKLDARRSKLEIIADKGSAADFLSTIEENSVKNNYIWARPVQNKNDEAQTDDEFRAILDTGDGSIADQEMSNCSVVPVEDGVLIVAHHYKVGVVVFKLGNVIVE